MSLDAASVGLYNGTAPHRRSSLRRSPCPSRGKRDRVHRNPGRPREQPQGHLAADPEAPDHDLHGRVRIGEVVGRVRHHRDRGAAPALRELQPVHPQLPAALSAARGGRHREPEHGGHRRPEAARRRIDLDGRHDHRHLHRAATALLQARRAPRRLLERVLVQRPTGHVPRMQRPGQEDRRRVRRLPGPVQVAQRGRRPGPRLGQLGDRRLQGVRLLRQRQEALRLHARGDGSPPVRQGSQVQAADRRQVDERHLPRA